MFYPFLANVSILYPLKTPENQRFSCVFRGNKMGTLDRNGLMTRFSFHLVSIILDHKRYYINLYKNKHKTAAYFIVSLTENMN